MLYFQRILSLDKLVITSSVSVPYGGGKRSPRTSMYFHYIYFFLVLWDCRIHNLFKSSVELNPELGGTDSVKPRLLLSNSRCSNFKGSPHQIYKKLQLLSLCRVAAVKSLPLRRLNFVAFTFSGPLGL